MFSVSAHAATVGRGRTVGHRPAVHERRRPRARPYAPWGLPHAARWTARARQVGLLDSPPAADGPRWAGPVEPCRHREGSADDGFRSVRAPWPRLRRGRPAGGHRRGRRAAPRGHRADPDRRRTRRGRPVRRRRRPAAPHARLQPRRRHRRRADAAPPGGRRPAGRAGAASPPARDRRARSCPSSASPPT